SEVRPMADDKPAEDWYIAREGKSHGPVSWDNLLALLRSGQVSATDFVWHEGLDDWTALGTLVGPATPPPPATTPAFQQRSASPPRALPIRQAPAADARRGPGRVFAVVAFAGAILAAAAAGYLFNSLLRDTPEVSESRSTRAESARAEFAPRSAPSS